MDASLLHALNGFAFRHHGVEGPLAAYVKASELLFLGALVLLIVAGRALWRRSAAVAAGVSAAVALAVAAVLARLVDRPRPFVADPAHVHLLVPHATDPGFPSDHATAAFAIAIALLLRSRALGAVALVAAFVLAVGRVALGIHYPTDVLGGALLGAAIALVLHRLAAVRLGLDALTAAVARPIDRVLRPRAPRSS